ncbi:HEPN domain-containing protein [Geoglobus acetivorans]|uniref:HEPN domain-containing protein n=1 Tax=Geoglobus acetivorans TaxID=565033 RepID=A0ABZ3H909_GEOAI
MSNLENAYVTSRYLPFEFEKIEIENMFSISEKVRKLVDGL